MGLESKNFNESTLRQLAQAGGGEYSFAPSPDELNRIYDELGARLASDYLVRYSSVAGRGKRYRENAGVLIDGMRAAAKRNPGMPAVELLRQALNAGLSDPALHYGNLVYKHSSGGRNIAPAILTRLGVEADRTQLLEVGDLELIDRWLAQADVVEIAEEFSRLSREKRAVPFRLLAKDRALEVFEEILGR